MALTRRTATIVLTGLFGWTCAAGAQRVVEGPAKDVPLKWTLTREWSIGGAEDDDLVLVTLLRSDMTIDRDRLYVSDRTESRVVIYGSDGRRLGILGRRGAGPGEFLSPGVLTVAADRTLLADDHEKERTLRFDSTGRFIDELPPITSKNVVLHRLLDDGTRVGRFGSDDSSFVGLRRGAQRIRLAAQPRSQPERIPSVCRVLGYAVRPIFEIDPSWDASDSTVVISTGGYAIDVRTRDVLTHRFTRPKQPRRSTRALAREQVGTGTVVQLVSMPPCTVPADMILAVAKVADVIPAYNALTLDHRGRVWATHFTVGDEPGKADVYDLRSGYLGTVNLGSARPATFFADGRMVSIELDEDEVPMIRVYRITP